MRLRGFTQTAHLLSAALAAAAFAFPPLGAFADHEDRDEITEARRRSEIEKRQEAERNSAAERHRLGSHSQPLEYRGNEDCSRSTSVGYVTSLWALPPGSCATSGWALPRSYTSATDLYRHHHTPKGYCPAAYHRGFYYYLWRGAYKLCRYPYWVTTDCGNSFCRRSVYYHYGFFPYVQVARTSIIPYTMAGYIGEVIATDNNCQFSMRLGQCLNQALLDIRTAWTTGRIDLIARHTKSQQEIAVLLDGRYEYSVGSRYYVQMTADAMDNVCTISFVWENIRRRADGTFTAFGRHSYTDLAGAVKTIHTSYTLKESAGSCTITEVGSSTSPPDPA